MRTLRRTHASASRENEACIFKQKKQQQQTNTQTHKTRVCAVGFLLMMYTDIHGVLFQFACNQRRYMVIHELCCWSQSNPGSGLRRFIADRVVNYPLPRRRFRITQRTHKFSAQHLGVSPELTIVKPDGVRATFLPSKAMAFIKGWLFQQKKGGGGACSQAIPGRGLSKIAGHSF